MHSAILQLLEAVDLHCCWQCFVASLLYCNQILSFFTFLGHNDIMTMFSVWFYFFQAFTESLPADHIIIMGNECPDEGECTLCDFRPLQTEVTVYSVWFQTHASRDNRQNSVICVILDLCWQKWQCTLCDFRPLQTEVTVWFQTLTGRLHCGQCADDSVLCVISDPCRKRWQCTLCGFRPMQAEITV